MPQTGHFKSLRRGHTFSFLIFVKLSKKRIALRFVLVPQRDQLRFVQLLLALQLHLFALPGLFACYGRGSFLRRLSRARRPH